MMEKSRSRIGRRSRIGWFLALFLLVVPAPVLGGVEWTLQVSERDGSERTQPVDDRASRGSRTLDAARSWASHPDGSVLELRGSEWT